MQPNVIKCARYFLLLLAFAPVLGVHAQDKLKVFNSCNTSTIYRLRMGDTVLIQCDSSILLSKSVFNRQLNNNELFSTYEKLIAEQDTALQNSHRDYNALKLKFDTLFSTSIAQMQRTSQDVGEVKNSLNSVTTNLTETKVLIGTAIDTINKERKKSFLSKLYWGVGGLGIGVAVTALLVGIN